jgi:hypothetical protein
MMVGLLQNQQIERDDGRAIARVAPAQRSAEIGCQFMTRQQTELPPGKKAPKP